MNKKNILLIIVSTALASSVLTILGICALISSNVEGVINAVRFFSAIKFVESRYVTDVDPSKLIDGAISGMVQSLGDPHSIYLDDNMYRVVKEHTDGSFGGIGVYMGFKDNKVTIISVIDGTPGAKAGLKAGDEIAAVDGKSTGEMQPEEVALKIRGKAGTDVALTIHREGEEDISYNITRDTIKTRSVAEQMLDENIGYIRIGSFSENTGDEFKASYDKLANQNMRGLIVDLRHNPGGVVTSCVKVANMLVPEGLVVSVVERDGSTEEYNSHLKESKYPLVVLIDGNSASASEILAGALQDRKAATLVGTKSYGKGSVQVVMPMFSNDAMKLTVAKYYTPNGRNIDGSGIEPDVEIGMQPGDTEDVQLAKAIEVMKTKI